MHTPVAVTEQAMETVRRVNADCLVAIGGGSTIGLGKAIALRTDLPQIAIPTTYAGSEATPILGQTEHGVKTTRRGSEILPETIVYDVDLTLTMPRALSVTSGLNAIAHAVEGLYARDANPLISMLALDGIRALAGAFRASAPSLSRRRCAFLCRQGGPFRCAVWRMGLRGDAGGGGHVVASQAVPHAGRHFRSAACADPCGVAAPCHGLQCAGRGARHGTHRSGDRREQCADGPVGDGT
jgi:hypothetical protein